MDVMCIFSPSFSFAIFKAPFKFLPALSHFLQIQLKFLPSVTISFLAQVSYLYALFPTIFLVGEKGDVYMHVDEDKNPAFLLLPSHSHFPSVAFMHMPTSMGLSFPY